MLSIETYNKIKENLFKVTSYYALQDYNRANPDFKRYTKTGKYRHPKPYSLSDSTEEARETYNIMFFNTNETLTQEQEEQIKGYLLRIKMTTDILN